MNGIQSIYITLMLLSIGYIVGRLLCRIKVTYVDLVTSTYCRCCDEHNLDL